jgi:serine/threonine-protein kinase
LAGSTYGAGVPEPTTQLERLRAALAARYRVVRELGRGAMATVYLAHDLKHDRRVALKVLPPQLAAVLGPDRFLREIRIAAALAHPHILPLHDSGEADGLLYYVMPFVEGESLRDRLASARQLPVAEAVRIAQEVADGLDYAHTQGVVHRDIKPENILLLGGHAVIADFGVATALDSAAGPRLTETGFAVGTPQYMSPEQALAEPVDGRCDTYALGCVLYEMLAGDPPFTGSNTQALLARKLHDPPTSLAVLRETVSLPLAAAVQRALARAPADRFTTTREFAAAVGSGAQAPTTPGLAAAPGRAARSSRVVLGVALAIAALAGVWLLRTVGRDGATTAPAGTMTIAVLPFDNLGPADREYFAAGMTEEITARLGSVSGLGLVPRRATQARVGAGAGRTLRDIGRDLGTDYLLAGSVRWGETTSGPPPVRITLQLVRARDERQIWATTYDRTTDDIFEVQSDIAGQVIERLGLSVGAGARQRLAAAPTGNREAYTLYLKGRYFWNKRTEADIQTALEYFERAVDLDPSYALAWAGIGDVWIFRGFYSRLAPRESFPKAKSAVARALEFDSTLAEAHASLAHIRFEFDHDWDGAEREYRRAIELNPSYPTAHHWYGGFLSGMRRHEEALREAEAARGLDPLSRIVQTWIGLRHYFAHRYDAAIAEYLKALELEGDFAPAHWHLGWAYAQVGRLEEAVTEAERALALDPGNLIYLASVGHAYALTGRSRDARAVLARLDTASTTRHVSAYHVAAIHIALGDTVAGLDWLERALAEQSPWIGYLLVDPRVDALRRHPRFTALLRKASLQD